MKMNFDYFQIKKSMLQTVRAEKAAEKKRSGGGVGSFVYFSCYLLELWSLNCLKKCIFAILC